MNWKSEREMDADIKEHSELYKALADVDANP